MTHSPGILRWLKKSSKKAWPCEVICIRFWDSSSSKWLQISITCFIAEMANFFSKKTRWLNFTRSSLIDNFLSHFKKPRVTSGSAAQRIFLYAEVTVHTGHVFTPWVPWSWWRAVNTLVITYDSKIMSHNIAWKQKLYLLKALILTDTRIRGRYRYQGQKLVHNQSVQNWPQQK